ncbi:hypothetical protein SAMN05216359_10354 [Roseateles sp. YR242]|uniref:polymer-forming cytoskeletal protein n=1 Tax=Roseateles sp. YR242 TaxID=1855305 RepID=UPI0008AAC5B7|nr:polymer-forming cytoskeletal protein [Roseateles sp. YR242]SEK78049.1 hypothetical protein SAMN05216359_10354 [Roseateles sp. YR242]
MNPLLNVGSASALADSPGAYGGEPGEADESVVMRGGARREATGLESSKDVTLFGFHNLTRDPINTRSGNVQVQPGARLLGPASGYTIRTKTGNITIRDATLQGNIATSAGHILIESGSRVEGKVEHLGGSGRRSTRADILVNGAEVNGDIEANRIELVNASVRKVSMGDAFETEWAEARLEVSGQVVVESIECKSRCLIVGQGGLDNRLPTAIGAGTVQYLDLTPPTTLAALMELTRLPACEEALPSGAWHEAQHQLERLCSPALDRHRAAIDPNERLAWGRHLTNSGTALGQRFATWLEYDPARLLLGLKAQSRDGLERSCAALAVALLVRDQGAGGGLDRWILEEASSSAAACGARWPIIQQHINRLEGRDGQGAPWIVAAGSREAFNTTALSRRPDGEQTRYFIEFRQQLKALGDPAEPR